MSMENKMLQIAQERYTTKHYSGKQIPREQFNELLEILHGERTASSADHSPRIN